MPMAYGGTNVFGDQEWKHQGHWFPVAHAQPQVVASRSSSTSSWNSQSQAAKFARQLGLENSSRPLPYPPVAPFKTGAAVNLASTFKQLSMASKSDGEYGSQPPQMFYPAHPLGSGVHGISYHPSQTEQQAAQGGLGPAGVQVHTTPAAAKVPVVSSRVRKQAEIRGPSWRRSDDARNYLGTDQQARLCPNKGPDKGIPYQACECTRCVERNRSIFVALRTVDHAIDQEHIICLLGSGLSSLIGEVEMVYPAGPSHGGWTSSYFVK